MNVVARALEQAAASRAKVVFPEGADPRIREAAERMVADGVAEPVFPPSDAPGEDEISAVMTARPGMTRAQALRMLARPLFRAGAMVAAGRAEAMVAGVATATGRVIEAAAMTIGPAEGMGLPSSFFLICLPDGRAMIFADCAVNVAPETPELVDIAVATARSAERLLGSARVAMLSFSTLTSGSGDSVDRMREATDWVRSAGIDVIGPVQADAALNPAIGRQKGVDDPREANVLIFPTLDAGNIGYKLVQELAGAQAIGPVLQGFARPVCDLSRGACVDDIVAATAVTLALA